MRKIPLVLSIWIVTVLAAKAQFPAHFGQYMFNPLVINPAYAGSKEMLSVTLHSRLQWTGFPGAPKTFTLAADAPLKDKKNNFGLLLVHDRFGVARKNSLFGIYTYRLHFPWGKLAMGLQGGVILMQERYGDLAKEQEGDHVFEGNSPVFAIPKAGFGLFFHEKRFYAGVSIPELFHVKTKNNRLISNNSLWFRHFLFSGGVKFAVGKDLVINPSFLIKYLINSPVQADVNVNFIIKKKFLAGASVRIGESVAGILQYRPIRQLTIGYSYEIATSRLRNFHTGSHEIVLGYEFGFIVKTVGPRLF